MLNNDMLCEKHEFDAPNVPKIEYGKLLYWTALRRWGIFKGSESQSRFHREFGFPVRVAELPEDDPGSEQMPQSKWHVGLPQTPTSFPKGASFKLTRDESNFIQGRLEEQCKGTLLGWLARNGMGELDHDDLWETSAKTEANSDTREAIEHARRFSLHVEGMPLLYNLLIAELRIANGDAVGDPETDTEFAERFRQRLHEWAEQEDQEKFYDADSLYSFAKDRLPSRYPLQHRFVKQWSARIQKIGGAAAIADDSVARKLITNRELQLKKNRARLSNLERLRDWDGNVNVRRMDFRWSTARDLLRDLFNGLDSS